MPDRTAEALALFQIIANLTAVVFLGLASRAMWKRGKRLERESQRIEEETRRIQERTAEARRDFLSHATARPR